MKRALLIAGGTVGGLGAVLAITPPQLSNNQSALSTGLDLAPVAVGDGSAALDASTPAVSATPVETQSAQTSTKSTTATTSKKVTTSTKQSAAATTSPTPAATKSATASPTPAATKAASSKSSSGTFIGDPYTMRYGTVQVQITISGGKITDAQAIQAPSGRDQRYTDMAVPVMRQKTLAAQSANITGVSGASYTAYGWYISLQSALKKAGWM
jgi:uncharacterized protein with FMN-binding domain